MRIAVMLIALAVLLLAGQRQARAIEAPSHSVEKEANGYEVRVYEPFIVAEVTVEGDRGSAMNNSFRQLADFIFGNNREEAKISMTAPVIERAHGLDLVASDAKAPGEGGPERHVVTFVMPREYTLETLPTPHNDGITIRRVEGGRYAVASFSGYARAKAVAENTEALMTALERDGVATAGGPLLAQYDPPWTLPWNRRNEVLIPLAPETAK